MDKKRSVLNVAVSLIFKVVLLVGALLVRRFLIQYIGNEVNGLASLFISIIGFLAVAELGVGEAISFCMYRPIVEGDIDKVSALYRLFRKLYMIISVIVLVGGFIIMPFLPYLAKDYSDVNVNIYLTFALTLLSVVFTYFYGADASLIQAHKDNYITTTIHSVVTLIEYIAQILVIYFTSSFIIYTVCRILASFLNWAVLSLVAKKKYGNIVQRKARVDKDTKQLIVKNVKAMFLHKTGSVLVNASDSLIISAFIGVVLLGLYTNYTTIIVSLIGVLSLFFTPLTSIVGHVFVEGNSQKIKESFDFLFGVNYALSCVFFLGYYSVIDSVITLIFGPGLELDRQIVFVITFNYFLQFMRRSILLFRDATGTFYYDRYKPFIEGIVNVILSIALVNIFGIVGVIVATIITNLIICDLVEPYVLYKYAFRTTVKSYYLKNYSYILLFFCALVVTSFVMVNFENQFVELLVNGLISIGISIIPCCVMVVTNSSFRKYIKKILSHLVKNKRDKGFTSDLQ